MSTTTLFVILLVLGIVNLVRALRGMWKKSEYTALGSDPVSKDLARPLISRYMVSMSVLMIVLSIAGLIKEFVK